MYIKRLFDKNQTQFKDESQILPTSIHNKDKIPSK